jgi:ribosomal protein S21
MEITNTPSGTSDRSLPCPSDDVFAASFTQLNSEMLVHRTNAILRGSRPSFPWLPSSLGALQISHIFRGHSWSSQSKPANWSHLNDIYSRAVDVKSRERPSSPDERWAIQSRSRMATLMPPKGPYAGKSFFPLNPTSFSYTSPGRSIEVKNGNVADALNKLQYTLQRNRVMSELRLTARHEKKGYKRRRLSSERWRKRFAHEVRASLLRCDVS